MLPVYFYIVQNSILNKHTHVYSNGLVVTHSHTLDLDGDEPANNHEHSQTEICLYCGLSIDLHLVGIQAKIDFISVEKSAEYRSADTKSKYASYLQHSVTRGPPARIV